jgi:hypothetical protein
MSCSGLTADHRACAARAGKDVHSLALQSAFVYIPISNTTSVQGQFELFNIGLNWI